MPEAALAPSANVFSRKGILNMYSMLKVELKEIYAFLKRHYNEFAVISLATLFLMLAKYHHVNQMWIDSLLFYGALPILSIIFLLRKNPLDFGLRLGDYKVWAFHLLVSCPIIFLLIYLGTSTESVQMYYRTRAFNFNPMIYILKMGAQLWAWEFIFRGFMLFGLKDKLKENAIFVQMIPFALLHFGKPESETISCIFSGIYFGYICYRGNSFWPAFLLHCFINYSTVFLVIYLYT